MPPIRLTRVQKLLASASIVTLAASLAAVGTSSTWSTTQGVDQAVTSGSFGISLDGTGVASATSAVSNLAPGDVATRLITVTNTGNIPLAATTMSLTGDESPLLDGTSKGLQLTVDECSQPWVDADANDAGQQANPLGVVAGKYCSDPGQEAVAAQPASNNGTHEVGGNVTCYYSDYMNNGVTNPCRPLDGGSLHCSSVVQGDPWDCSPATVTPAVGAVAAVPAQLASGAYTAKTVTLTHGALAPDTSTYLLVSLGLPATLGDGQNAADAASDYATYGGKTATLHWSFTATQRPATTK